MGSSYQEGTAYEELTATTKDEDEIDVELPVLCEKSWNRLPNKSYTVLNIFNARHRQN